MLRLKLDMGDPNRRGMPPPTQLPPFVPILMTTPWESDSAIPPLALQPQAADSALYPQPPPVRLYHEAPVLRVYTEVGVRTKSDSAALLQTGAGTQSGSGERSAKLVTLTFEGPPVLSQASVRSRGQ